MNQTIFKMITGTPTLGALKKDYNTLEIILDAAGASK